ncbi:hypothetical protein ASPACDRAFT_47339 [Aspergillus aculeatus ATCC 16872]|uniref:Copper transport protein n=1 Tax=Aspergillus aculeatus (strain ATCC 16872 / CBS 172.66 / WB 5094) TaxID=690307 RepID=A0A1L9WIH1_ASPA1|nr:uncharacterized protein ASPACDRAFT_47339 [Aspergillus aculeatus ATCC 16872]OJJ95981.1 hypothetical protein ASPACDRAFT_47339 [Aspergillus aculeatus ATCC 16872]
MAMAMGTSTATSSSTTSMSTDSSSSSVSMSMTMVFFTSTTTPLYSNAWTPSTTGQYAGTCIFLIALAVILRFLLALKPICERSLWNDGISRSCPEHGHGRTRWAINPAAGRATLELVVAGVGYLLMLAVMTMNVGYFLSVLAGLWLGTFVLGGWASDTLYAHH